MKIKFRNFLFYILWKFMFFLFFMLQIHTIVNVCQVYLAKTNLKMFYMKKIQYQKLIILLLIKVCLMVNDHKQYQVLNLSSLFIAAYFATERKYAAILVKNCAIFRLERLYMTLHVNYLFLGC